MGSDEILAISLLWVFIFVYAMAASIDFGAGFWALLYQNRHQSNATKIANRYLSPSWEVTNVFIIFIVIGLVSFFPGATDILAAMLLMPFSIALLLLALRSAFLVYSHAAKKYQNILIVISGVTGFLIPAFLILVLPLSYGSYIKNEGGFDVLSIQQLLSSFSVYAYLAFAVTSTLFLSSLMLTDYSNVSKDESSYKVYHRNAVGVGPLAFLSSVLVVVSMKQEANWFYENLLQHVGWLIASVVLFFIGYIALFIKPRTGNGKAGIPRLSVISIVLQYMLAAVGYGMAHLPYIVYPTITIQSSFTDESTFHALFVSYMIGFAILSPGFYLFWRMFMKDKQYLEHQPE